MTLPSIEELAKIEHAILGCGYVNYTVNKKDALTKQFSQKKHPQNPYFVVKNNLSNRVFQIKWEGDFQAFLRDIIVKIERYEKEADLKNLTV
ncbi:MAG: hypothetical protein AB8G05_02575 [Oligoflexales bacterium]